MSFNVRYIKHSTNPHVDCFSKLGPLQDKIKLSIVQIHEIICRLKATYSRIQLLCKAIVQDDDFCSPKHIVPVEWLGQVQEVPLEI